MIEREAVIVGGGIGGLAAAVALRRAGWEVRVFERAPEFGEIGAGLSLWPNALRALARLGLHEQVLALGTVEAHGGVRDRRGRWLSRTSAGEVERRFGHPLVIVRRADLLRVLREALPDDALCAGTEITRVPDAPLVVAADGAASTLRERLYPGHRPRYAGYTAWRMLTPFPALTEGAVTWGHGERFGFTPMTDGLVYCFATASVPPGSFADDEYAELLRRFAGWPQPIPALLAATAPQAVLRHDITDLPPLPSFVHGRVAFLGDAAHAMTPNLGQGACQALEDAVTLAACVSEQGIPAGLARYDRLRRRHTQAVVRRSRRLGRIGQLSWPPAVYARDTMARLVPAEMTLRAMTPILNWGM
ncbi:FAD-dependent monooxygenase [Catellatospora tritici]|uniref:FAD-dependent monooxygenase n=1 Tax=Catellatospora tritici TaxID=2851566 RepID=UPI001C2DAFF0|nr:FAD-dependent monooxygenase [Catellatospora tritici]MBV1853500.1 FAD-dependent monooxygenase [Catellatospora tritici]